MPRIGIIAGSGFSDIGWVKVLGEETVLTPYGTPSDAYRICEAGGVRFVLFSRHGRPHRIPPHRINYRANIWGFRSLGVERILAVNAVGGVRDGLRSGDIVIPDQVIDFTGSRLTTFYDEEVVHIDFTDPYCPELRSNLLSAGEKAGTRIHSSGTYACVSGPRLETKAEITLLRTIGAAIVGMTGMPEACLARELEICFAGIAVVTNAAAGISAGRLTVTEVVETMKVSMERIGRLLSTTLSLVPAERGCTCGHALRDARI